MKSLNLLTLCLLCPVMTFARSHRHQPWKPDRHRNIAAAHAGIGGISDPAYTVGLEYEHFFTQKGWLSAALLADHYKGGTIGGVHSGQVRNRIWGNYIAPGVRFHPAGSIYRVDPSIGAFVLLGHENRIDHRYGDQGYSIESREGHHLLGAVAGQASITFHSPYTITTFGLFCTAGYLFAHSTDIFREEPKDPESRLYLQFGLRLGGQW